MKNYTKKGVIASITIMLFLASSFLIFLLQPWIVFLINVGEMLIFGLVFRYVRIPRLVFILGCLVCISFAVINILFPQVFCPQIAKLSAPEMLDSNINAYRIFMIIFSVAMLLFIGFIFYVNFFDADVGYNEFPEDVSLTGILGVMGAIIGMVAMFVSAMPDIFNCIFLMPIMAIHSALSWFIKCYRRGWVRNRDSYITKHAYDINTMSDDLSFLDEMNKNTYNVTDENGEQRRINYDGKSLYSKCSDDKGDMWETTDGGAHFKKCGVRKIRDENGIEKIIYGSSDEAGFKRYYTDKAGNSFESDDGGDTVHEG
ncbi:MAG: hypothetical protein K2O94_04570 [Clostridiales bacterium]|nr:hypothetical protein [Clostridiales bacterium]